MGWDQQDVIDAMCSMVDQTTISRTERGVTLQALVALGVLRGEARMVTATCRWTDEAYTTREGEERTERVLLASVEKPGWLAGGESS